MKTLNELAAFIGGTVTGGNGQIAVTTITHDSREVIPGTLFICEKGAHVDGHDFIDTAIAHGAVAIMTERADVTASVPVLHTRENMADTLSKLAPYFHDYPARAMRIIGITGTNGKTTVSYMIRAALLRAGFKVGLIGTLQIMIGIDRYPIHNTTPDPVTLQNTLAKMRTAGCDYVVMEVSSHALALNRIAGIDFSATAFTNLTQDHLDFHKNIDNYRHAKARLFAITPPDGTAAINIDDKSGTFMLSHAKCRPMTYGIKDAAAFVRAENVKITGDGVRFLLRSRNGAVEMSLKVTGLFNVYNALCAAAVCLAEHINIGIIKVALENFTAVPGRFEAVRAGQKFTVIVDYAHTPDGMENVLATAKTIVGDNGGRIITVFGCGGDRDPLKRPIMGRIAAQMSDTVIATSDNPRTEDPAAILRQVEEGIAKKIGDKHHECIEDRRQAIFRAIELAQPGDIVMILGKGHEDYQILKDKTIHFDDKEVARDAIGKIGSR